MRDCDTRMIEAQASMITRLNASIASLRADNDRLFQQVESQRAAAGYYRLIESTIQDNPTLQDMWVSFLATVRLSAPGPVPGLTCHLARAARA